MQNFLKTDEGKCNVNFKYRIANIENAKVKLIHVNTGDIRNININVLRKYFIYAYCYTAHSKQGCSVDSDIVIYDWNFKYACRNWFYTSLTRARDLNRVWFYRYPESNDDMLKEIVENYLRNKIKSYKNQDAKTGREIESDEYVDETWLMGLINTNCECCGCILTIDFDGKNVISNMSAQRCLNDVAHFKSNCKGLCIDCNKGLSNTN